MKTLNKDLAAVQLSQVIEQLTDLADYELIAIHNDYCKANNDSYSHIIDNDDAAIDSMFDSPSEAMRAASFGDYNHSHNYFILDGYANLVSFNYASDDNSPIDISELAQWLINEDRLADYGITVTTLDDMLASIEDNITDDENMLLELSGLLSLKVKSVEKAIAMLSEYNYKQLMIVINHLGINYE